MVLSIKDGKCQGTLPLQAMKALYFNKGNVSQVNFLHLSNSPKPLNLTLSILKPMRDIVSKLHLFLTTHNLLNA